MHCSREADQKDLCQASKIAAMPSAPASEVKNTRMSAERSRYVPSLPPSQCKTLWKCFCKERSSAGALPGGSTRAAKGAGTGVLGAAGGAGSPWAQHEGLAEGSKRHGQHTTSPRAVQDLDELPVLSFPCRQAGFQAHPRCNLNLAQRQSPAPCFTAL